MFSFVKKIYWNVFSTHQWFILYRDNGDGKWIRLKQPIDVSRADAFVVMENGKVYIFFEEFKIEERHGYLCVGELNKTKQSLDNVRVVLEKKYHLSFPNVFKYQDKYYMIPESHENNSIELYEFVDFPYKLKKTRDLISNVNAVDSVFLQKDNLCYLFTNKYTHKDCLHSENLSIFVSDDLLKNDFKELHQNPVTTNPVYARMGGSFFVKNNKLFRVAQDCTIRYGYKINLMLVDKLTQNKYEEHLFKELFPPSGYIAFHTLNTCKGIEVADGKIVIKSPRVIIKNIVEFISLVIKRR
jgi:hypothetical protein